MNSEKNTTLYSEYYEENLYKLQNGVLNIVRTSGVPFYLTGGTALSRGYYKHRYSDDLDFFVNKDPAFQKHTDCVIATLLDFGYTWDRDAEFYKTAGFLTMRIHHKNFPMGLKIDFVNDVVAHFGKIQETDFFYRTDSVRNILSNKISASVRFAVKDMVDIREICLHENFNWGEIFEEVNQKELGLEADTVSQILEGTPKTAFEKIKWISKPSWEQFQKDLQIISKDMLRLSQNSLVK